MTQAEVVRLALEAITLLAAALAAYRAHRAKTEAHEAVDTLHRLEITINGRMSQLLELTEKASHAEGMVDQAENPRPTFGRRRRPSQPKE